MSQSQRQSQRQSPASPASPASPGQPQSPRPRHPNAYTFSHQDCVKGGKASFRILLLRNPAKAAEVMQRFYGRAWVTYRDPAADAERAATRRAYDLTGMSCEAGCGSAAVARHHREGIAQGHGDGLIARLCATHHREADVARIAALPL